MGPTTLRQTLAHNIRALLAEQGRTVVALADFADVSNAHLYDVLACNKAATVDFIQKVAEALGCDPASLLRTPERENAPEDSQPKPPVKPQPGRRR